MNTPHNRRTDRVGPSYSTVCPYLGLQDDPHTHFAWPQPGHFCYHANPPHSISIEHQESYCLNRSHTSCIVYADTWHGPLPPEIQGEFSKAWRVQTSLISLPFLNGVNNHAGQSRRQPEADNGQGEDPWQEMRTADFVDDEEDIAPRRGLLWLIAAVTLVIVLLVGGWGIFNVIFPPSGGSAGESGSENSQIVPVLSATATATPTELPPTETPQPTPEPTFTATPTSTQAPTETSTPTSVPMLIQYTCDQIEAYTFELLSGPEIYPDPGYVYVLGSAAPSPRVTWVVQNTGQCDWTLINLLSVSSQRLLSPVLRSHGEITKQEPPYEEVLVRSGDEIDIMLGFIAENARYVQNEWILEVNGFRLTNQAHLTIDAKNWVIAIKPTATVRRSSSSSSGDTSDTSTQPEETVPPARP